MNDQSATSRRRSSERRLQSLGVTPDPAAPDVVAREVVRDVDEIASRAVALCLAAARSEGLDVEAAASLAAHFGVAEAMTPSESFVVFSPAPPSEDDALRFRWGYEACWALEWVLGYAEELGPPTMTCDARRVSATITEAGSLAMLVADARERPRDVVLDEADFTWRLFHACLHAVKIDGAPPAGTLFPVVLQRQHAFAWMTDPARRGWDETDPAAEIGS